MQKKSFKAKLESIHLIQEFVKKSLHNKTDEQKILFHIDLIIEEVVVNIVKHGFNNISQGTIDIETNSDNSRLNIKFSDNGIPFNPLNVDKPVRDLPVEKRKPGGLGIFFIKQLTKKIDYTFKDNKNNLSLSIKY